MRRADLETIINEFPDAAEQCVADLTEHILEAAVEALKQTQDEDGGGKPKVAINIKLTIDLSKRHPAWDVKAAVGVKYQSESGTHELDDPAQPLLNFAAGLSEGESVTIKAGDTSATIRGRGRPKKVS